MKACINLREAFPQCRVSFDPACEDKADPWMQQIRCKRGYIYPFGGSRLAVECDYHPAAVKQLEALPFVECTQAGAGEYTFVFDMSRHREVFAIVRPLRRSGPARGRQPTRKELEAGRANLLKSRKRKAATSCPG